MPRPGERPIALPCISDTPFDAQGQFIGAACARFGDQIVRLLDVTVVALVFGNLLFANFDPTAGTLASFGTVAVGSVARPIGRHHPRGPLRKVV